MLRSFLPPLRRFDDRCTAMVATVMKTEAAPAWVETIKPSVANANAKVTPKRSHHKAHEDQQRCEQEHVCLPRR